MQALAWDLTVMLVVAVAVVFLIVRALSGSAAAHDVVQATAYRLRTLLFWALVVIGIPAMALTLTTLPYDSPDAAPARQVVSAMGYQWYWELDRATVKAGAPIEFRVTSADVNHGLGLYNSESRLLAQTQAMPGYVNRLYYTFERPGTYRLMCLEYCGLVHHGMIAELTVAAP